MFVKAQYKRKEKKYHLQKICRTIWTHMESSQSSLTHKTFAGVWQMNKTNTSLAEVARLGE